MDGLTSIFSSCNPCTHFSRLGVSVSRACPGECESDCACCCCMPIYAHLVQLEGFTAGAGMPLPFTGSNVLGSGLEFSGGLLTLPGPGVYHVRYQVNIPGDQGVFTNFVLRANGVDVPGTQQTVSPGVLSATAEAVIEADESTTLGLYTTSPLNLTASTDGTALATLTLTQL